MKAEYKRDLQDNYLILEAPAETDEEDYRLRMAEQNKIPGLLPLRSARKDGVLYLNYEITSRQPLESVFEKKAMGYEDIVFLLEGIRDVLEEMQKFLLDPAQLIFDPGYLFVSPDRRSLQFCYLPGNGDALPVAALTEFVLRRLEHRDQQAVALGYEFYQKANEENFSLGRTVHELLASREEYSAAEAAGQRKDTDVQQPYCGEDVPDRERTRAEGIRRAGDPGEDTGRFCAREEKGSAKETPDSYPEEQEYFQVTHRERKRHPQGRAEKLFKAVHPAVLLSGLFLLAVLEIAFYFGWLTITEAGGLFFLVISAETLANRLWKSSREKKQADYWPEEQDEEMYQMLREEMYEAPQGEPEVGETRCLVSEQERDELWLICVCAAGAGAGENAGAAGGRIGPDVHGGQGIRISPDARADQDIRIGPDARAGQGIRIGPDAHGGQDIRIGPDAHGGQGIRIGPDAHGGQGIRIDPDAHGGQGICIGPDIRIPPGQPVYVGKIKGESDVLLDSPTVSRRHARLECRDGIFYVKDLNSRNGTFLNGRRLKPQEQCQFAQGDEVAFAEIRYRAVWRSVI